MQRVFETAECEEIMRFYIFGADIRKTRGQFRRLYRSTHISALYWGITVHPSVRLSVRLSR